MAIAGGFKIADAFVEIHADRENLERELRDLPRSSGPAMDRAGQDLGRKLEEGISRTDVGRGVDQAVRRSGRTIERSGSDAGGKLSQGLRLSIIRNSPLIVAGIGAALAAGAPVATAGAVALFGAIGVVAAAQSERVQSAWVGLWNNIKTAAVADAGVLVPVLVGIADRVGAAFVRMRPLLQEALRGVGPLLDTLASGFIGLAENALPGFLASINRGGPVFAGLRDFLERTGTGLSNFFETLSRHSGASGQVLSQLGQAMERLLPILAELLGQGAELAADVLPLLTGSLGMTLAVLRALGPLLPGIVAGIAGLKIAQAVAPYLTGVGNLLGILGQQGGLAGRAMDTAGRAVGGFGRALPGIGVALGGLLAVMEAVDQKSTEWAQGLLEGGAAARKAGDEIAQARDVVDQTRTGFMGFIGSISGTGAAFGALDSAVGQTNDKYNEMLAQMSPLQRAHTELTQAENNLSDAIARHGATSREANAAREAYRQKSEEVARAEGDLQMAIHGVTEAMVAQADQAMAGIDSGFAYRHSLDQLQDAQATLAETIRNRTNADKDLRTTQEDVERAQLGVEEQTYRVAAAYGRQQADLSNLKKGTEEYDRYVQVQTLARLKELQREAGPEMAAAIQQQIDALEDAGVAVDELDDKSATPKVSADMGPFNGFIARGLQSIGNFNAQRPTPTLSANPAPFQSFIARGLSQVANFHAQRPTPVASMNTSPFAAYYSWATGRMGALNAARANPIATLYAQTAAAEAALNWAARARYSVVYTTVQYSGTSGSGGTNFRIAGGGKVGDVRPVHRFDGGGRVSGPGGPGDDRVRVLGPDAMADYRLSNLEWIIQGRSGQQYGDRRMQAVNDGSAVVMTRDEARTKGFVTGGSAGDARTTTTPEATGGDHFHLHLQGVFDFTKPAEMRRIGLQLWELFDRIKREHR